jgi:predicted N-acyltransferase
MATEAKFRSTSPDVGYRPCVYESIRDADWDEWNALRDSKSDPFMDPRYILAVENSMGDESQFRHVLVRDEEGRPAAAACLCSFTIDGSLLAEGGARIAAGVINRVAPFLLRVPLLLCGFPVSAGGSHLRFAPDADRAAVLRILDDIICDFAKTARARCIVFKEFEPEQCRDLAPLESLGYRRADSLPMNCAPAGSRSFDDYVARVNSARRRTIRRSREKFASSGLKVVHLAGGEGADALFTDDVYRLYGAVLDHATVRFERLPAAFFREVARQMPDNSLFTFIYQGDRVVAFAITLVCEEIFEQMFVGFDYRLNPQCDLYFNLFFESLGAAFARAPRRIHVGQTSDDFKHQKLSAFQVPLSIYVKGCHWLANPLLARTSDLFFPSRPLKYPA